MEWNLVWGLNLVSEAAKEEIIQNWNFNWPVMDVLIGGKSSIDLPGLMVEDWDDAGNFLRNYGYDPDVKQDARQIHAHVVEATKFIERLLMPREWGRGNVPPLEVLLCKDGRELLLWASDSRKEHHRRKAWSCAILRVMHTLVHLHGVQRRANVQIARNQIMGRFEKCISRDDFGHLWLGDDDAKLLLERVEWKNSKSRDSIILKLLHKPGNVAETIYDILGIRIITKHRADVMMTVKYLRDYYLVTFPNTNPARSRNTIIELSHFKDRIEGLRQDLICDKITPDDFLSRIDENLSPVDSSNGNNPHTSSNYHAIQLTCRQLIRYQDPDATWKSKIEKHLSEVGETRDSRSKLMEQILALVDNWSCKLVKDQVSVFFPFEVQILDAEAAYQIECGDASHDKYKLSQIRTARRRILGEVLQFSRSSRGRA